MSPLCCVPPAAPARAPCARLLLPLLALALLAPRADAALGTCKDLAKGVKPAYKYCQVLRDGVAALQWRTANKGADIYFRYSVAAPSDVGWVGFGFSDMGSMAAAPPPPMAAPPPRINGTAAEQSGTAAAHSGTAAAHSGTAAEQSGTAGAQSGGRADLIVIHAGADGAWTVTDANAKQPGRPSADAVQDVKFIGMEYDVTKGYWVAEVARKLKTCDVDNDWPIEGGRGGHTVWAFGSRAGPGFTGIQKHPEASRGYLPLQLLPASSAQKSAAAKALRLSSGAFPLPKKSGRRRRALTGQGGGEDAPTDDQISQISDDLFRLLGGMSNSGPKCTLSECEGGGGGSGGGGSSRGAAVVAAAPTGRVAPQATAPKTPDQMRYPVIKNADGSFTANITCSSPIPNVLTTYMTCYIEWPFDQAYHVTSYSAIYGHPLVHHSLVYACAITSAQPKVEALIAVSGPGPYNQKSYNQLCEAFYMVGGARSAPSYVFPKQTGLPLGKDYYQYLAIEVHYNNPDLIKGEVDQGTGERTRGPRLTVNFIPKKGNRADVGIFTVSQFLLDIPGNTVSARSNRSTCHSKCTQRWTRDVTLIAQNVHMHGLGRGVYTSRKRFDAKSSKWVELQPYASVKGFAYAYQTWIDTPDADQTIKRGDELSMQCDFSSVGRGAETHFGYSTQDEMCFWWLYYYPAMPNEAICSSLGDLPFHLCAPAVDELIQLKDAQDANDLTRLNTIVRGMVDAGRAYVTPANVLSSPADAYDPKQGCSSALPP